VAEQTQDPTDPKDDPREAGFGPGEDGDSIEEGREAKDAERGGDQDDSDES
jgi:hypothetical protein